MLGEGLLRLGPGPVCLFTGQTRAGAVSILITRVGFQLAGAHIYVERDMERDILFKTKLKTTYKKHT